MSDEKPPAQQAIKAENLKRIFLELHRHGEMTRVQLSRSTNLSAATVSALVDELVRLGLFIETGPARTDHIGRKPINLRIRPDGRQLPVFALTRNGARFTLYDLNLQPLETLFVPLDSGRYGGSEGGEYPDSGQDYADLLKGALEKSRRFDAARAAAVCVVSPGAFDRERDAFLLPELRVRFSRAVMAELEKELQVPLFFGKSSMARAYAEKKALDAAGEEVRDLIYLCVSDSVSAGILCGGDLFLGAEGAAGEIGRMAVDWDGVPCACLERYVNVNAILEPFGEAAALESVGSAYEAGNPAAVRALDGVAEKLFRGICGAVCLTGIRRVVIGGGVERLGQGFLLKLRSLARGDRGRTPTRDIAIDYSRSAPGGDALGIASYFLDRVYPIVS